jgi:polyisoprenoid-binding protein YceI
MTIRVNDRFRAVPALSVFLLVVCGPARGESTSYSVDQEGSRLRLELGRAGLLKMFGHDHTIEAPLASGRIEAHPEDVARSTVVLRWDAARLAVVPGTEPAQDIPEVEARMRGPEVLDVSRYPQIVFTSSSVAAAAGTGAGDGAGEAAAPRRLRVRGILEIKGRRTEVEVPLEVRSEPDGLVATGRLELNLRDLGIDPPAVAGVVKVANRFRVSFSTRWKVHEVEAPIRAGALPPSPEPVRPSVTLPPAKPVRPSPQQARGVRQAPLRDPNP